MLWRTWLTIVWLAVVLASMLVISNLVGPLSN